MLNLVMGVDVMDELMYDTLVRYFRTLAHTGYKSYDVVFKMIVIDFIYEITHTELRYYVTNKDIKLMQDLLYQLFGSTCEISFPTNNRPCCVCVCCNNESTTKPPVTSSTTSSTRPPSTTTTSSSTKPPVVHTYLSIVSDVADRVYIDGKLYNVNSQIEVEPNSTVTIKVLDIDNYEFVGFYKSNSLISSDKTLQYTISSAGSNQTIEVRYQVATTTSTTSSSTSSSTKPPKATVVFKHDSRTAYSVTYNTGNTLTVSNEDKTVEVIIPSGSTSTSFTVNSIKCTNTGYECKAIGQGALPCSITVEAGSTTTITPTISVVTTTSSTTTQPPVVNTIYHGVLTDYMSVTTFRDVPLATIMEWEGTKSQAITGSAVNIFNVPLDGFISYLVVPSDKTELIYADFVSGGITTTLYDSSKESVAGSTNNGAYYSKYTRGGKNANPGGTYNGINYDVFFCYNGAGSNKELGNIKAKNK